MFATCLIWPLCAQVAICCEALYGCLSGLLYPSKQYCCFIIKGLNYSIQGSTFPWPLTSLQVLSCYSGFLLLISTVGAGALLTFVSEQLSNRKLSPQRYNIMQAIHRGNFTYGCNAAAFDVKYGIHWYFDTRGPCARGSPFIIWLSCHLNGVENNFWAEEKCKVFLRMTLKVRWLKGT